MAINFNIMTRELGDTEMLRSDFVNNISHEFKTPLTSIQGYATLLQNKNLDHEKRQMYIEKKSYSLDEQLRQVILLNENQWSQKKLQLDIDLDTTEFREILLGRFIPFHRWQWFRPYSRKENRPFAPWRNNRIQ